ncbi:Coronin [Entamoeba marina]
MFKGSKYKHLQCKDYKSDQWYPDVRPNDGGPEVTMIAASANYVAVNWKSAGAGVIGCIPLSCMNKRKEDPLMLQGHTDKVIDIVSCPFDDNLFFSSSMDATIRCWKLPYPTELGQVINPTITLNGHKKKVDVIAHHFAAPLIASGSSDNTIKLWDYEANKEVVSIASSNACFSMDWSYNGDTLITTEKSKKLQVYDFRSGSVVKEYKCHDGIKASNARFASKTDPFIFSVGFDRMQNRQYGVYDLRLDAPVAIKPFPSSSSICCPVVDIDTSLIYINGRGDSLVKVFEFDSTNKSYISEITQQNAGESLKGIALVPKRSVNVKECEINKLLRLGQNKISKNGSYVIRRASTRYQDDLYPDTIWVGQNISAEDYLKGENAVPKLHHLKLHSMIEMHLIQLIDQKSTHFRHINIKAFNKNSNIIDCRVNVNNCQSLVRVNTKWAGKPGKMIDPIYCDNGGNVNDFLFDSFNEDIVYVGGEDGKIKIFEVSEESATKTKELLGHTRKITGLYANPFIKDCIVSTGAEPSVKFWDVVNEKEFLTLDCFGDQINNISFNSTGEKLAVACRDGKVRIFNCRTGDLESETDVPQNGGKGFMVAWCGRYDWLFTIGFTKTSQRSYSLFDITKDMENLVTNVIDVESAVMTPIYDEDLNVVFLIGRGSKTMHCFEITDKKPFVHPLNVSYFPDVVYGFDTFHKQDCNVKVSEIMRLGLLTGEPPSTISRTTVYVPRVHQNYFQDDIFPDTRKKSYTYTVDEWCAGDVKDVEYVSLQPEGMEKLSVAAPSNDRAKYSYEQERKRIQAEEEEKKNAAIFERVFDSMNTKRDEFDPIEESDSWSDD